jgi:CubicO group peptidase (beta-lactamase class C family)
MDALLDSVLPKIRQRIHATLTEHHAPGAAVAIVRDQELAWAEGFGLADIASKHAMTPDALFGVASISKTFTGAAIVQLRDEGKLSLDDPLANFIPEFKAVTCHFGRIEDVTLRRLLTHLSGLVGESPTAHWRTATFPTMEEILAGLAKSALVIEPHSAFKYSNLGFALLGEVVARVSGRPFTEYLRREILDPLGMKASCFTLEEAGSRMATGYLPHPYDDVPETAPATTDHHGYAAAAGLRSSVEDLAKWISLQFRTKATKREGAQVLAGKSLSEMHRVVFVERDWRTGYCLAWWAIRMGENICHEHGGSNPGFLSSLAFNKQRKMGVVALTNAQGHAAGATIAFQTLEILAQKADELGKLAPLPEPIPTPQHLKPLLGRYEERNFGGLFHVEFRAGELMLTIPSNPLWPTPPPPTRLLATDRELVFTMETGRGAGEPVTFVRSQDGTITELRFIEMIYRKVS